MNTQPTPQTNPATSKPASKPSRLKVNRETSLVVVLEPMEVLQIRMLSIHLKHSAQSNLSLGVNPKIIRKTVAYWFDKFGHSGVSPKASWKTLHKEFQRVFEAVLAEPNQSN